MVYTRFGQVPTYWDEIIPSDDVFNNKIAIRVDDGNKRVPNGSVPADVGGVHYYKLSIGNRERRTESVGN